MKTFSRIEVVSTMEKTGLVPLFYHPDIDVVKEVVKACYDGGARLFEFTSRGMSAHTVFAGLVEFCSKECPEMILGVGSVTDAGQASHYMNLGANFIVTPVFREDVARVCNRRKIAWFPGCGSLTEIAMAEELGCEVVKLFPGGVYGPQFVSAVKGPQPWTKIMPTGGVDITKENLSNWFNAGVVCVGIGSKLFSEEILQQRHYSHITNRVEEVLHTINKLR